MGNIIPDSSRFPCQSQYCGACISKSLPKLSTLLSMWVITRKKDAPLVDNDNGIIGGGSTLFPVAPSTGERKKHNQLFCVLPITTR